MTADRIFRRIIAFAATATLFISACLPAYAGELRIAVAANFTTAAKVLSEKFRHETGHVVHLSFGSTGQLFSQITQGAPFDLFLSADQRHPRLIRDRGLAADAQPVTYAIGKLVLWSLDPALIQGDDALETGNFDYLAIANPETAPYGKAAVETMQAVGLLEALEPKLVRGNSVAQTFQFIASGNAPIGFVALSQVAGNDNGSRWLVPENLYQPIRQDAVLLRDGIDNPAAVDYFDYLSGPAAKQLIEQAGYATPSDGSTERVP